MSNNDSRPIVPPGQPGVHVPDAGAAAVASAHAPFIFFDAATVSGVKNGVAFLTLEAIRHLAGPVDGAPLKDFVVTAHLRCDLNALRTLKQAIEQVETLVRPGPAAARN